MLDAETLLSSWTRALRAENKAERTLDAYTGAARSLLAFSRDRGLAPLERATIEEHLAAELQRVKPATVSVRYRACSSGAAGWSRKRSWPPTRWPD